MVSRYQPNRERVRRISGPLLDQADLWAGGVHFEAPQVEAGSASRTKSYRKVDGLQPRTTQRVLQTAR
jgi:hypothetical protein